MTTESKDSEFGDPNFRDRRRFRRIELDLPVSFSTEDGVIDGRVRDISRVGLGLVSPRNIAPETLLAVDFTVVGRDGREDIHVDATAAVVRSEEREDGQFEIALFFLMIDESARGRIDRYIDEVAGFALYQDD